MLLYGCFAFVGLLLVWDLLLLASRMLLKRLGFGLSKPDDSAHFSKPVRSSKVTSQDIDTLLAMVYLEGKAEGWAEQANMGGPCRQLLNDLFKTAATWLLMAGLGCLFVIPGAVHELLCDQSVTRQALARMSKAFVRSNR